MELLAQKDRYGLPVDTVICRRCGLVQTNPMLDQESLNQFYDSEYRPLYVEDKNDDDFFQNEYQKGVTILNFLSGKVNIDSRTNVLEIGTGMGGILKAIHDKTNANVTGIDLGGDYIEKGKQRGLNLVQIDSKNFANSHIHKFHLIIICHVLEHFLDLRDELMAVRRLLAEDGTVYIEVPGLKEIPNSYRDFMGYLQNAHVRHFTKDTLDQIMRWNGYSAKNGNEMVQGLYKYTGITDNAIHNYYEDNVEFLRKLERRNFLLIHVRYPLARIPALHRIYNFFFRRR